MAWYVLFPLFLIIVATFGYKRKEVGYFMLFLLFFFSAFRGDAVGHDTMSYMDVNDVQYKASLNANFEFDDIGTKVEVLNNVMNAFVYYGNFDLRFIIYIYSFVTIWVFYLAVRRFNANIAFSCLFYVLFSLYFYSLTAARQLCAASFLLYAYSFLCNAGKWRILFFVWVIVATLIHSFSIFFIFLYFVKDIRFNRKKTAVITFFICLALLLSPIDILSLGAELLGSEKILRYLFSFLSDEGLSFIGKFFQIIKFFILVYVFYVRNNEEKTDSLDNTFITSVLLYALVSSYPGIIGRIHYDLSIIQCVYFALYLASNNRIMRRSCFCLYIVMVAFLLRDCARIGLGGTLESPYYLNF